MTKLFLRSGKILGVVLLAASAAFPGPIAITIIPSVGPSNPSTSLEPYLDNAEHALEFGLSSFGASDATHYTVATGDISSGSLIRTPSFNSWLGITPGAFNTAVFNPNGEFGNELYFGIAASSSIAFNMADVTFSGTFGTADLSTLLFNAHTVGVSGGTGTNCSGGFRFDGSVGHTGNDATPINCLWYSGLSISATENNPANLAQALIDYSGGPVSTAYALTIPDPANPSGPPLAEGTSAPATLGVVDTQIPEPGTIALWSLGFGAMLCLRKKAFATRIR